MNNIISFEDFKKKKQEINQDKIICNESKYTKAWDKLTKEQKREMQEILEN